MVYSSLQLGVETFFTPLSDHGLCSLISWGLCQPPTSRAKRSASHSLTKRFAEAI